MINKNGIIFSLDDDQLATFLAQQESQYIEGAKFYRDRLRERMLFGNTQFGAQLPWQKTAEFIRLRPSEVTIWSGINGHGKSQVLGQVALWLMLDDHVTVASMEMKPETTLQRMVRQATGVASPSMQQVDGFLNWADPRLAIYDQTDSLPPDRILAMIHYAAIELGSKHVIIDSLMKCGIKPDDFPAQASFMNSLTQIAKRHDIHVHLVHHIRKGNTEEQMPDKHDLKGAGELSDLTDNLVIMFRNKSKERRRERGDDISKGEPDSVLRVVKQRNGEWEGDINLWFHQASMQYVPKPEGLAMPFPNPAIAGGFFINQAGETA